MHKYKFYQLTTAHYLCYNIFSIENVFFFSCQASFETPWFAAGEGCNMSFFYHMSDRSNSDAMGTLSVEVKTVDKTWFILFRKAGDQNNTWHQGTVDLSVRIIFSRSQIVFIVISRYDRHQSGFIQCLII